MTIAPIRFHSVGGEAAARVAAGVAALRAVVRPRGRTGCCRAASIAACSRFAPRTYCDEAERHADAGRGEADVPVDALREVAGDERPMNAPRLMPM